MRAHWQFLLRKHLLPVAHQFVVFKLLNLTFPVYGITGAASTTVLLQ